MQSSRFACLPDDDAADAKVLKQQEKERKKEEAKKNAKNKPKEVPKAQKEAKDLQNLAFGGNSKKKNKKKNKQATPGKDDSSNFEEWKERDKAAVEDNFSAAMHEAILQSKLEFEHQKQVEAAQQQMLNTGQGSQEVMDSLDKEERKKVVKMQKKLNTMTLDQFNSASDQKDQSLDTNGEKVHLS